MTRHHEYHINQAGETVSVLDIDTGYAVWNHEHAVEVGVANTLDDAQHMIEG